jgi:uncharacterized protein YbjT (DUF2867 family)
MTESTILVTGISGFIAKHCAVELLEHGYRVRGTVRDLSKAQGVRQTLSSHADASKLEFVAADLLSDHGWSDAAKGVQGVLHVASPFPLLAGPGAISTAIIAAEGGGVAHQAVIIACIAVVCGVVWLALRAAHQVAERMGTTGMNVATRILGLLLAAMAVQTMAVGLKALFPGLA